MEFLTQLLVSPLLFHVALPSLYFVAASGRVSSLEGHRQELGEQPEVFLRVCYLAERWFRAALDRQGLPSALMSKDSRRPSSFPCPVLPGVPCGWKVPAQPPP